MRLPLPLLALALLALPALPSPPPAYADAGAAPAGPPLLTQVVTLRYKSADDAYVLVSPYLSALGSIRSQPRQKTLTITDAPETVRHIQEMIAGFDLPPRVVEVAVQLILATAEKASAEPPPPPIRGVVERLNALNTRWSDYRLVGDARVLGTEGERSTLRIGDDYKVDFSIEPVGDEGGLIRFKPFELARREITAEGNERYQSVLQTVLNLRDSQLFIVGASKMERSNRALFMTIRASLAKP